MAVAERSLGGWGDLPSDWAWLMHLSPHDLPGSARAALAALAVAGAARLAGRGGRLGTAAGALGLLAGWGVLDLGWASLGRASLGRASLGQASLGQASLGQASLAPGEPAGRLAVVAAAALGLLLLGDAAPRRLRPLLPFGLGAASGWWLAGAPAHGARLLHALAAAALLGAATEVTSRRLGRGGGTARKGRTRRDAGVAPAGAGGPQGMVVFAAALALSGGLLVAAPGSGTAGAGAFTAGAFTAGAFTAALVALASAAALLPGPEGAAGLAPGLMAAALAAALGQGHWLRLPVAEDWAVDAAALSPLVVVALGPRLARRWGIAGPFGAAAALVAVAWGLAR